MSFFTVDEYRRFLHGCLSFEKSIVNDRIHLFKYWFEVSEGVQRERMQARINDPRKHWKFSPMDLESRRRWYDYSRARDGMLAATDMAHAPWYIVEADNKKKALLNCISLLPNNIPYRELPRESISFPDRDTENPYDDSAIISSRVFVPQRF